MSSIFLQLSIDMQAGSESNFQTGYNRTVLFDFKSGVNGSKTQLTSNQESMAARLRQFWSRLLSGQLTKA